MTKEKWFKMTLSNVSNTGSHRALILRIMSLEFYLKYNRNH